MFLSTVSELTKVDELVVREGKRIVDGQGQRVALIISFILELRRLAEGFIVMFSLYYCYRSTQANGATHAERPTGMGSDGMIEMVLLFLYYRLWLVVFLRADDERMEFPKIHT